MNIKNKQTASALLTRVSTDHNLGAQLGQLDAKLLIRLLLGAFVICAGVSA